MQRVALSRRKLRDCEPRFLPLGTNHPNNRTTLGTTKMCGDIDIGFGAGNLTLAELVEDPLVGLMMKSDGVDRGSIVALFERITRAEPKIGERHNLAPRRRRVSVNCPR